MGQVKRVIVNGREESLRLRLQGLIKTLTPQFIYPQGIFFSRWVSANSEGRQAFFFKVKQNKNCELEYDIKTNNKAKIWLYTFPDHREDYLIERIWKYMERSHRKILRVDIKFTLEKPLKFDYPKDKSWNIELPKDFLSWFNGEKISQQIEGKIRDINKEKEEADLVEVAKHLRYNVNFNKIQSLGTQQGYKKWLEDPILKKGLTSFFKLLYYGINDPLMHTTVFLRFLFMWQNFSITKPFDYSDVSFYFFFDKRNPRLRSCLGLFSRNNKNAFDCKVATKQKDYGNKINSVLEALASQNLQKGKKNKKNLQKGPWTPVKKEFGKLWRKIRNNSIDPLMELAGELAFVQHEGKPSKFAFIAGTEQIWPVEAEIVSIDFYSKEELRKLNLNRLADMKFDPGLYNQICRANYSIFQVPRVVGFFNTAVQTMYKVIRLHSPSEEESRELEDPVVDNDDLFCWAIGKIFDNTQERAYIVSTEGDGKVRVYGKNKKKGELLLVWDVGKNELHPPVGEDEEEQRSIIRTIKTQLGVKSNDPKFRKIIKVIRKISANAGEGAALILAGDCDKIDNYLTSMELLKPSWLRNLSLEDPHYILHAAFITDGACLITKEAMIKPRQAIYSHHKGKAWGLLNIIGDDRFKDYKEKITKKLSGKGSKTHSSSNISTLPRINFTPKKPQLVVISISVDGPIKIWPKELVKR